MSKSSKESQERKFHAPQTGYIEKCNRIQYSQPFGEVFQVVGWRCYPPKSATVADIYKVQSVVDSPQNGGCQKDEPGEDDQDIIVGNSLEATEAYIYPEGKKAERDAYTTPSQALRGGSARG